ncbi:hypothetical protein LCGC14_1453380 [marine sediment metagenome]|uniref:Transposase n=1 Tax=marine sediment metagenome TaxID=412755 RepID=A0A0F9K3G1_9ZZZZ
MAKLSQNLVQRARILLLLSAGQSPKNALVMSVDEKTQIQALDRTRPKLQLTSGQIERRALDRGIFISVDEPKAAIRRFIKVHNEKLAKPFRWHKSAESIMTSVARAKLSAINDKSTT